MSHNLHFITAKGSLVKNKIVEKVILMEEENKVTHDVLILRR
jgi:hypothetical protein